MKTLLVLYQHYIISFLILVLLSFAPVSKVLSQPDPSIRHLKRLINEGRKSNDSSVWPVLTCNEDSAFLKNDTIIFYDDPAYFDQIGICCEFTEWEFITNNLIRQQEPQTCLEPSSVEVSSFHYYSFKLFRHKGRTIIRLFNDKKEVERFFISNIEYIELANLNNCRAITLVRTAVPDKDKPKSNDPVKITVGS